MMFLAIMGASLLGVLCSVIVIHRQVVRAKLRTKSAMFTWVCLTLSLVPNWFVSLIVGGNFGGGWASAIAEEIGGNLEIIVAIGIFGVMTGYLIATMILLALICDSIARWLLPE